MTKCFHKKNIRLISENAACRILRIESEELERLCLKNTLTKHETLKSLYQYDFEEVIEYRKTCFSINQSEPSSPDKTEPSAQSDSKEFSGIDQVPQLRNIINDGFEKNVHELITEKRLFKKYKSEEYLSIDTFFLKYLIKTPLYCKSGKTENYVLYKASGETVPEDKLNTYSIPDLFILKTDRKNATIEIRLRIINQIKRHISKNEYEEAKVNTIKFLEFILFEHDETAIEGLEEIVEVLFVESLRCKDMIMNFIPLLGQHINLGLHSTRIMILALKFCLKNRYSLNDSKLLCTSALLHDIGKTMLPPHVINCNPYLTNNNEDLYSFQLHPQIGFSLLVDCGIKDNIINYGALEHHERIDGSGFPSGKRKISFLGQVLGLLDTYDTLRNGHNQNGVKLTSMETLKIMKKQCEEKQFSNELFQSFVYSLL